MLKPRLLGAPPITSTTGTCNARCPPSLILSFTRLSVSSPSTIQSRAASHATQGRANGAAPGPGKRLGAKKGDSELVVPGNIIFRQRGSHWFPGENCVMGRDHTISALAKGYVRYYRDPERHPKRKYIGVVFERDETLPRPRNARRRRRLGMNAVVMEEVEVGHGAQLEEHVLASEVDAVLVKSIASVAQEGTKPQLTLRENYQYRESNTSIGRAADRAGVKVRPYKPGDRWLAWRKANARKAANAERRSLKKRK